MASVPYSQAAGTEAVPQTEKLLTPHEAPKELPKKESKGQDPNLVKVIKRMYDGAKQARKKRDSNWSEYWDFYNGKQWGNGFKKNTPPNVNIQRAIVQTILPIMTDTSPSFGLVARDPNDFDFAELFVHVVRVWWNKRSLNHVLVESLMDACVTDVGIMKVTWNPDMDDGRGDVEVVVRDPRNVYVPKNAVDFDRDCPWVIDEYFMSRGKLSMLFQEHREDIKNAPTYNAPSEDSTDGDMRVHIVSAVDQAVPRGPDDGSSGTDVVGDNEDLRVWEIWMDDDTVIEVEEINQNTQEAETIVKKKYPHGRMITMLPDAKKIVQDVENPRRDGEKPFVRLVDMLVPRSFYGDGEIGPTIDTQKMVNKTFKTIFDWANMMSNPCWIIDNNSGVEPDMITNAIGQVIVKNPNTTVMRQDATSLPPQIFELYHTLMSLADTQSGVHDVTQGRKPAGITAATAIETLQEAAQTRVRLKERNLLVSLIRLGRLVVSDMLQNYTEPRIIQITGVDEAKGNWPDYIKFYVEQTDDGENAPMYSPVTRKIVYDEEAGQYVEQDAQTGSPSVGDFELEVTTGSSMPYLKEQRSSQAMRLWETQAIDQQALLDVLDFPEKDQVLNRMNEEKAAAAEQQQGQPPPPEGM